MLVPDREDLKVMNIDCDADAATIEMTQCGLLLIIDAVASWLVGAEDFGISPRHASLKPKQFGRLDNESGNSGSGGLAPTHRKATNNRFHGSRGPSGF